MTERVDLEFGAKIRDALGEPLNADFDTWLQSHQDAVAYLNPVVTATYVRRRRFLLRLASGAAVAAVFLVAAFLVFTPQKDAFAQTIKTIKQSKTISWTIDWYDRLYSVDGSRSWLRRGNRWEQSYLAPSRWRDVRYAEDGTVAFVKIEDTMTSEVLTLNMQQRTATLTKEPSGQFGKGLPFEHVATILKNEPLEFVGQQNADGVKTNVFRHFRELSHGRGESMEIWLDAESKRLVKYCTTPGNDYFDPQTAPDRHNVAEAQFSKGTIAGVINRDIAFDAQLDPSLFSLTPPTGFAIVDPPQRVKVTEEHMIQWLRLSAEANGGVFLGLERGINMQWHNAIVEKPETERTVAEQKYVVAAYEHIRNGNTIPVQEFADSFTVASSFRYLGKGIQLGDKDRIVCFYKFKSTGTYRAVYGDLSVIDVNVNDLPLPVE